MTHIFETPTHELYYIISKQEIHDDPTRIEEFMTGVFIEKGTGKVTLAFPSKPLPKPEEELLKIWKEQNYSKYVKSYN